MAKRQARQSAEQFVAQTTSVGGASRNVHTLAPVGGRSAGFIVGVKSPHEAHVEPRLRLRDVNAHRRGMLADPQVRADKRALQGSWKEESGKTTLDYSRRVANFGEAVELGIRGNQDAIYQPGYAGGRGRDISVMVRQPNGTMPYKSRTGEWDLAVRSPLTPGHAYKDPIAPRPASAPAAAPYAFTRRASRA